MDSLLLLVLGAPVLWLITKERKRDEDRALIQKLTNRVFDLEQQLRALKNSFQVAGEPPATSTQPRGEHSSERGQAPSQLIADTYLSADFTGDAPGFVQAENTTYRSPTEGDPNGSIPLDSLPLPVNTGNLPQQTSTDHETWSDLPPGVTQPQAVPAVPIGRSPSLEERLGANWLNKLGIVILVIGLSLFLAYQLRTLGPLGKTIVGLVLSLALLAGGLILERQSRYRVFARAAIGGGWALTFFVMYAMYHVAATRVLSSQLLDLILMMLTASGMVWHSLRYRSQVVTALAFLLAFATVGISHVTLFSLVAGALLAAGLVYVSAREYWYELGAAGLVAVYGTHFLWLSRVLPQGGRPGHAFPAFIPSALLLLFYWLLFRIAYVARTPRDRREELIASSTAVLNSIGLIGLLKYQSAHPEWGFYAVLALGTAEFVLAFYARHRRRPAFVVLSSIASILFLSAIPLRFSGASWSLLWLLEAEALLVAGLRMREVVFRRLGLLGGVAAAVQLMVVDTLPIVVQQQADRGHHSGTAAAPICGALLFWVNAEAAPLHWKELLATKSDVWALIATSYLGLITAVSGLWLLFPGSVTIVVWMALACLLGLAADKFNSKDLATQADLLSILTIGRAVFLNLQVTSNWHSLPQRAVTVSLVAAGLYLVTRRKTGSHFLESAYLPAAYSWAASALVTLLLWYQLQPAGVAVGWGVLGLVLFEISIIRRRTYLRQQGYLLLALSFLRIFVSNLNLDGSTYWLSPRLYTVLPLLAGYYWVYERLRTADQPPSRLDRIMGEAAAWATTVGLVALAYFEVAPEWVIDAWAALVLVLVLAGWRMKRTIFVEQAIALLLVTGGRAILFNLFTSTPLTSSFWNARLFSVTEACALILLCLPIAFKLRSKLADPFPPESPAGWIKFLVARPEQPLFFVPLVVCTVLLAVQMRSGVITIAWSALGLFVFCVALAVRERSYRLAGLALLLLGVGKIIFVDIWAAAPADRYITLIVMGAALLLVSFLYSRYRETVLRFL